MKTYNQFLNTPFSEEIKPPEPPQEEDPGIKSKETRQKQIKKMVLLKKLQAVRAGAGADIVASYEPEGEVVEGLKQARKNVGADKCWDGYKAKGTKKKGGKEVPNCVKEGDPHRGQGEKIQKRTKDWMDKKGMKGAPGLDAMKAREAEHRAKRGVKEEVVDEGIKRAIKKGVKIAKRVVKDAGPYDPGGYTTIGSLGNPHLGNEEKRKKERAAKKKVSEGTDKAFEYVKKQIAAKYGKSGYVSKDNPRKPQTDAEKAKVRAHQAKVDKENAAARAKDPSQGRYPKG